MLVGLAVAVLCMTIAGTVSATTTAINDLGELDDAGGLSGWTITASELREGENFTIAGDYTSANEYTAECFIAIRWAGIDNQLTNTDPGLTWWEPEAASYTAGKFHFSEKAEATGNGRALIQIFFEDATTLEKSYLQEYVEFEAANDTVPPTGKPITAQVMDFALEYGIWLFVLIMLFVAAYLVKGPVSLVFAVMIIVVSIAWLLGYLPTMGEIWGWIRGAV